MTGLLIFTLVISSFYVPDDEKEKSVKGVDVAAGVKTHKVLHKEFDAFRRQYMTVYAVIMLADWMQGTHMYTLYLSYGVNISALFLTGFLSGALFAPFLGSAVDKFGRKRACIVYCVLEVMINLMEHSTNFSTLLAGRVLGGISTNLLFSAFESWMTTEHRKRGFPEDWLTRTYSEASMVTGGTAVLAGIVAQVLEDWFGQIGPFQGAIGLTMLALLLVLRWEENYGEEENKEGETTTEASVYTQFIHGWTTTISDSRVWRIGMTQALSEGAMYTVSSCVVDAFWSASAWGLTTAISLKVCLYVGPNPFVSKPSWWRSHWLCVFRTHDGHHHGRNRFHSFPRPRFVPYFQGHWLRSFRFVNLLDRIHQYGRPSIMPFGFHGRRLLPQNHCRIHGYGILCGTLHACCRNSPI